VYWRSSQEVNLIAGRLVIRARAPAGTRRGTLRHMPEQATPAAPAGDSLQPDQLYGADYYAHYWGGGGAYERNERWLKFFGDVADGLVRDFHPATTLDAGCAMGFLVEQLRKKGVDASGFDISEYAISQIDESIAANCRVATLSDPIEERYDLITCIEVLEHLPPEEADAAVANLCSATDLIVMSSTPGDYGEPTHLNVLQPEDWAAKFAQNGFFRDVERDLSYLSRWTAVYIRRQETQADTVRRYDRGWWRLRREVGEVRESLIATQAALDSAREQLTSSDPELHPEIAAKEKEILRLRDLLIGKDLELGAAKGQLAVVEDRALRVSAVKERVTSKVPGLGPLLDLVMRLLRGR
jgi:2-polyprenyl-3-methyl-5-hydroxy-6-metoxy-1,4-benzoquinol methylase